MNGAHYEEWFTSQFIPNIAPNSVIVMDNAPYHSVKLEAIPTTNSRKCDIQTWLTNKDIFWRDDMLKVELLARVKAVRKIYDKNRIDAVAAQAGHTVLRLPPYHCELNPIENVWSQVKRFVTKENRTFKLDEIEELITKGVQAVTAEKWSKYCDHIVKEEEKMWVADGLTDELVERVQFSIAPSSSSDSCDSPDSTS